MIKMNNSSNDTVLHVVNFEITSEDDPVFSIIHILLQVFLFSVGLFINIKVICECKKDKGIAWKISVSHSIIMTIYYGYIIPFNAVTHFVPFLSQYTGTWICYISSFVSFYCFHAISAHSLVLSIMKYVFIVHGLKTMKYGESKIKKCFFCTNLINPLVLAIVAVLTSDLKTRSSLMSCFGDEEETLQKNNSSSSGIETFSFNTSINIEDYNVVLFYVIQFFCLFRSLSNIVTITNLPEGYIYYKIFCKMNR